MNKKKLKYIDIFKREVEIFGKKIATPFFNNSSISFYFEICLRNKDYDDLSSDTKTEIFDLISIFSFEATKPIA